MNDLLQAALFILIGFWWGEWFADRRAKKETDSAAFRSLFGMVQIVCEKRRIVGRYLTITYEERFEFKGEKFVLSLRSESDPARWKARSHDPLSYRAGLRLLLSAKVLIRNPLRR